MYMFDPFFSLFIYFSSPSLPPSFPVFTRNREWWQHDCLRQPVSGKKPMQIQPASMCVCVCFSVPPRLWEPGGRFSPEQPSIHGSNAGWLSPSAAICAEVLYQHNGWVRKKRGDRRREAHFCMCVCVCVYLCLCTERMKCTVYFDESMPGFFWGRQKPWVQRHKHLYLIKGCHLLYIMAEQCRLSWQYWCICEGNLSLCILE